MLLLLICIIAGCKDTAEKKADKTGTADTSKPAYAYTINKPDNWETGDPKNTALVLTSLKAFENNQLDESLSYFADSVEWKGDFMEAKLSRDSLKAMFTALWKDIATMKITMHDFESVISKDKKEEYVTLWYVETVTDKKGKTDSVATTNDIKIVNGKIVALDEALRHFPIKK